jgi:hypothetical protein
MRAMCEFCCKVAKTNGHEKHEKSRSGERGGRPISFALNESSACPRGLLFVSFCVLRAQRLRLSKPNDSRRPSPQSPSFGTRWDVVERISGGARWPRTLAAKIASDCRDGFVRSATAPISWRNWLCRSIYLGCSVPPPSDHQNERTGHTFRPRIAVKNAGPVLPVRCEFTFHSAISPITRQ